MLHSDFLFTELDRTNFIVQSIISLTLLLTETKITEFANSVDLDEVTHNEPPHLDLHCLPSSL